MGFSKNAPVRLMQRAEAGASHQAALAAVPAVTHSNQFNLIAWPVSLHIAHLAGLHVAVAMLRVLCPANAGHGNSLHIFACRRVYDQ